MADQDQKQEHERQQPPETILIAHVTAHLLDDSTIELYPFVDQNDVKAKVSELVGGWASSGFLLRGSLIIPWHRVRGLETTSVEEISRGDAEQRLLRWQAEHQKEAMRNFWHTKEEAKEDGEDKKEGEDEKEGDKG